METVLIKEKAMEKTCIFCDGILSVLNDYFVCDSCKTVCFSKDISDSDKKKLIKNYLISIQTGLEKHREFLHELEQKYINGVLLTAEEQIIRNNLLEFQDIRTELEMYLSNDSGTLNEKHIKSLLYRLLTISEWLSETFRRDA